MPPKKVHPFRVHSEVWVTSAPFACLLYRRRFDMYVHLFRRSASVPVSESFSSRISEFSRVYRLYLLQKSHHDLGYLSWLFLCCWPCILVIFDFMFQTNTPFLYYIYHIPLHVSNNFMLIIRRIHCIHTASGSLYVTLLRWPLSAQAVREL